VHPAEINFQAMYEQQLQQQLAQQQDSAQPSPVIATA
jgi:preprotein translocase subunit SecB